MFIIEAIDRNGRFRKIGEKGTRAEALLVAGDAVNDGHTTKARVVQEIVVVEAAPILGDHWDAFNTLMFTHGRGVLPSQPQD